eukprot:6022042-Pyramimonas_sp.AAC.1
MATAVVVLPVPGGPWMMVRPALPSSTCAVAACTICLWLSFIGASTACTSASLRAALESSPSLSRPLLLSRRGFLSARQLSPPPRPVSQLAERQGGALTHPQLLPPEP